MKDWFMTRSKNWPSTLIKHRHCEGARLSQNVNRRESTPLYSICILLSLHIHLGSYVTLNLSLDAYGTSLGTPSQKDRPRTGCRTH